ncbi:MAG: MFS transporter, partial [Acidobacteria bacterium]|nr:MFS transporter [Acidobacteriota bacterium]
LVPNFTDGWRVMFLIAAVGGLAVLPFRAKLPESPRWLVMEGRDDEALALVEEAERFAEGRGPAPELPELKPATARRPFRTAALLFLAIWLIYYVANYGWLTLAPTLLTGQGFSLSTSLTFLCVSGVGFVVGAWASVRYSERFERKLSIFVGLIVFAVSLTVIGLAPVGAVITIFGFIVSATIGFAVPLMYVLTAEQFSTQTRARGVAMGDGVGHIGGAAAPVLILPAAGVSFFLGMGAMAVASLIAAVLVLFAQRMTGRAQE